MKIVGLTGGIGSGKSTIAGMFHDLGIPIYIADIEAKKLLVSSKVVKRKVITLLGEKAYKQCAPDRTYIANKIFNDATLLSGMNAIIHPKVASHFKRWIKKQDAPYCIKEAAILFENGGYAQCDATILVTAPKEIRIERVMTRDAISIDNVEARMRNQWKDEKKISLATYVIENIALEASKNQVKKIHRALLISSVSNP
ncbi:MAG: dephospho-CoA kinase [Patiriisocius sp.]|jgi:dephospho-CoA kinase